MNKRSMGSMMLACSMVFMMVMMAGCSGGAANQKQYVYNVGASTTAGQSYRWVVPMCDLVNQYSELVTLNPITTTGSTENINLMVNGEAPIGISPANTVDNAIKGMNDWEGSPVSGLEYVYFMYPDYFYIILPEKSPVNSMSDLVGKTVSIGETGTGLYTGGLTALQALGYSLDDFDVENLNITDGCSAISEGWVDAFIYYSSPNSSAVAEMAAGPSGLKILGLSDEEIQTACAANPIFMPRIMEESYEGIGPVSTFGGSTALFASEDVPDEVTYEIARIVNEHVDEMIELFDYGEYSAIEYGVDAVSIVPMADGTQQYMRELGLLE